MSAILNIETAAEICSLAVAVDGKTVRNLTCDVPHSHGSKIAVFADELVRDGIRIDAVAVSAGPGSYTGLRIGCSFAKGFCFGRGIRLIAIPTLKIMAAAAAELCGGDALLCPMLDARRMEVYSAIYDHELNELRAAEPEIIDENSYAGSYPGRQLVFFGNGAPKCKAVIKRPDVSFLDGINPLAEHMAPLSEAAYNQGLFADLAYFEPEYLKEFIITQQKHKITPNL